MPSLTKVQTSFLVPQGAFELDPGTASAPGIMFSTSAATGMFSPSTGALAFSTGSTQNALTILSGGYVGIGTPNPTAKLHIVGSIHQTWSDNRIGIFYDNSFRQGLTYSTSDRTLKIFSTTNDAGGNIAFYTRLGVGTSDTDYGSEKLRITANGNVGVGITNPSYKLDILGDINFTGTFYQNGSPFVASRWTSGTGNDIYRLTGNVGIGTDNPQATLDVSGSIRASSQLISTVATGTAPLSVTSTTLVTNLNADLLDGLNSATANTASTIVARDASGNFSAGTITATLSGSSSSVANAVTFNNGGTGDVSGTTFNGSAARTISYNTLGASPLAGSTSLVTTGTVTTGTWSGSFGAVSGANLTSLTAGNLSGTIPSAVLGNSSHFIGTTSIALNRASAAQSLTGINIDGSSGSCTGNANTATTLATTRTIWGQNFNGSANVSGALSGASTIDASSDISLGGELNFTTANNKYIDFYTDNDAGALSTAHLRLVNNGSNSFHLAVTMARGGAVTLYHNNSAKLATSSTGVSITGTLTVSSNTLVTNLNADLLDGLNSATANTASTIVARDASGNFSAGTITAALSGNASSATIVNGTTGQLVSLDDRAIAPSDISASRLQFGFTSWANNNTAPYADYLHLRSYTDSSGGSDNLVMFRKDAIGMRIYQQTFGSGTAYASFKDVCWTDGTNATGTGWAISVTGSSGSCTGNANTATTLATTRTIWGQNFNGSANVSGALSSVSTITFTAEASDAASIGPTITSNQTAFDFNLADDNNNDLWRWRFTPSGSTVYNAMTLTPTANGVSNLAVAGTISGTQLISTVATGTAPLTVTSTTLVTNLNADLLDGIDSSGFVQTSPNQSIAGIKVFTGSSQAAGVNGPGVYNTSTWSGMSFAGSSTKMLGMHYGGGVNELRLGRYVLPASATATGNWEANPFTFNLDNGNASFSGTLTATLSGNASSATTFSTNRTNYKGVTDAAVSGQLMWKNYGNNHTIFDASQATSPSGGAVGSTNPDVAWTSTYPTLMGWNGTNTYGVRVDSARYADNLTGQPGSYYLNASNLASGTVPTARLGSGTASASTYLRGDQTWATISSGSTITVTDDTSTNATRYIVFEDVTSGTSTSINISSTKLTFNPSTGTLSATVFTSLSDRSKKKNIRPIENPIEIVKQLEGVRFDWIEDDSPSIGVIAQDVEKVIPEVVVESTDGTKSVSYGNIIGVLIEALKEQQVRIEELERKLNA